MIKPAWQMKSWFFLWIALVGLIPNARAASASPVVVALGSGTTLPGGSVTLPLSITIPSGTSPTAVQWTFSYSSIDVSGVSVAVSSTASALGKSVSCRSTTGSTTCVLYGLDRRVLSAGTIANASIAVSAATLATGTSLAVNNVVVSEGKAGTDQTAS